MLTVFEFEEKPVRFVGTWDKPEWIAQDICDILDIKNSRQALQKLKHSSKGVITVDTVQGKVKMNTVFESGLYKLIFTSRKENAERFQDWVFDEVLPSIRKTGSYSVEKAKKAVTQSINTDKANYHDLYEYVLKWVLEDCVDDYDKCYRLLAAYFAGAFDPRIVDVSYDIRSNPEKSPFLLDLWEHQKKSNTAARLMLMGYLDKVQYAIDRNRKDLKQELKREILAEGKNQIRE